MKLDEIPVEYKDRVEFACRVCREDHRSCTGSKNNCAWRQIGNEVCFDIRRVIAQMEREHSGEDHSADALEYAKPLFEVCDACGRYPKQPNSMLCKECEIKAGG